MYSTNEKNNFILVMFFVIISVFVIYYDSIFYGASIYDDPVYFDYLKALFENNSKSIAFTSILTDFVNSNWHPITVFSLAIDFLISGNNPAYFHLMNMFMLLRM